MRSLQESADTDSQTLASDQHLQHFLELLVWVHVGLMLVVAVSERVTELGYESKQHFKEPQGFDELTPL